MEIPEIVIKLISGMVPTPNNVMYKVLSAILLPSTAAANAMYTNPQGSKPFSMPIESSDPYPFLLRKVLNLP